MNSHSLDLELSSSQYASIADASQTGLDLSGDFTIEAWIKRESTSGTQQIVSKRTSTDNQRSYNFYLTATELGLDVFSDGSTGGAKTVSWTATVGVWYHVAVSFDVSAGSCKFYVNGVQQGSEQTGMQTSIYNSISPFAIGCLFSPAQEFFDGLIDDVRVWNDIRTAQEISDNWLTELVGNEAGLVGYWKLNNNYLDETSNNNDLTASGSPIFSVDTHSPFNLNGLVSYWKLDETTGNSADSAGSNTLTNTNVSYATGKINNGAVFNQATNKLQVDSNLGINGGVCSISLWVKMSANPTLGVDDFFFLTANTTSKTNYNIYYENNSNVLQLSFSRGKDNVGDQVCRTNVDLGTTDWHHCVLTYDGTNIEGFLDGVSIGTAAASGNGTGTATGNVSLVGAWVFNGTYGNYHKGMIDEVSVWSRVLTSTEVTTLYNSGSGKQYPFYSLGQFGLSYYKLDGNSNDAISSNNGTDTNITYNASYGKINQGADFNGSSSKIALPTITNLWTNRSLTICFWAKRDDFDNNEGFLYYGDENANNCIAIRLLSTGTLWAFIDDTSNTFDFSVTSSTAISDNNYHFYCVYFEKNASNVATIKLYIDGSLDASNTKNSLETFNGSNYRWIGGYISSRTYASVFDGKLDEIGLWGRQLSSQEITDLYNAGTGKQYPFSASVISKVISEVFAITEAKTRSLTRSIIENFAISESITKVRAILKQLTENLAISEITSKSLTRRINEIFNIAESKTKSIIRSISENFSISESISKIRAIFRSLYEVVGVVEITSKSITRKISEIFNLSESITKSRFIIKSLVEVFAITESIATSAIRTLITRIPLVLKGKRTDINLKNKK